MPIETIEEAEEKINGWITGRGIFTKKSESDHTNFQFEGRTDNGIGIVIAQPKRLFRSVVVASKLVLTQWQLDAINKMQPEEKADFIWDLKRDLIFAPANFTLSPAGDDLKTIDFVKEISFDELTDGKLIEAVDNVCRPLIWTIWVLRKRFGSTEEGSH